MPVEDCGKDRRPRTVFQDTQAQVQLTHDKVCSKALSTPIAPDDLNHNSADPSEILINYNQ